MITRDGNINIDGKTMLFSVEHFISDIVKNDHCFICGATPDDKEFNNEHIIPNWILRKYDLHSKKITLPNGTKIRYDQYLVPCCKECNTDLGKTFEEPIQEFLEKPYNDLAPILSSNNGLLHLIFKWMCLIFLKTHLKDTTLLLERDIRKQSGFIGDAYEWKEFHHIHCISRSHYTNAIISNEVLGSLFILPAIQAEQLEDFDYGDSLSATSIMLRLGDKCIIAVLNDCKASATAFKSRFERIKGALSPFQLREVLAYLSFFNLHLTERPLFYSHFDTTEKSYHIDVTTSEEVFLLPEEERVCTPGDFLKYYVKDMLGDMENKEEFLSEIESGKRNYLFDEHNEFIDCSKLLEIKKN